MTDALLRPLLLIALLLCGSAQAGDASVDADGFTRPLQQLRFNPRLDQREFERATLVALVVDDPWEEWNRRVYHFNQRFDEWLYLPLVQGYRRGTPRFLRSGVSHFFANLGEIPSLANHLMQLQGRDALHTTARLLFNTPLGVGGLWAPAQRMGLDSSSLVRVVDLLEDRGLVLRVTDAADRRSKQLLLTADGQAMVADVHGKLQRVEQQLLEGLPASAVQALVAGLLQLDRRLVQASQPPAAGTCNLEAP